MHEAGLAMDVLHAVQRRADGRRVLGAGIRVGASHRVHLDALDQGFAHVSAGTVAEGADLEVELVPTILACRACGAASESPETLVACPACGSLDVRAELVDELTLVWIRVADPDNG